MYQENEEVELKKSLTQLKEGIISMCSMLNKGNKGIVYFGINDDSRVVGVDIGKRTIADITHEIQNNLKPLPLKIEIKTFKEQEKNVIAVTVGGTDTPYSAYGRYYIRVNDSDIVMHSSQLEHFFESKKDTYSKWEKEDTKYGLDTIDEDLLLKCIREANEKGRLNYVYNNSLTALAKLGLITEDGYLNNAGYYLFSKDKPLLLKEAAYPTNQRTEFGEIKEFKGNIFECIQEATSYIQNHLNFKSSIIGFQREEVCEIPLKAIREIVLNSFAHRSYASEEFNSIIIFKSSLRIYNPGPIIKDIDPKKFASGDIGSKLRNPLISSVLYKCGYIDAFGTGFDRAFTLCADNNIEYSYHNDDFGFTFVFKRNGDFLNDRINDRINPLDLEIIKEIQNNKYITIIQLATDLNKSQATIQRHMNTLIKENKIKRIGSKKTGYWELNIVY